ncbi:MAG: tryptophan synthase subunit alpha [Firmicutes bacterium]|nr:tryptophan synthase subunit alpha [Bacillota bacterium]
MDTAFEALRAAGRKGLIAYITGGDPSPEATAGLVRALAEGGADVVEVGIPFSDPLADGPTIQKASERALAAGTTPALVLEAVRSVRSRSQVPIALLTYFNPVFHYGKGRFMSEAAGAGVDGLMIPDLPMEESEKVRFAAEEQGLALIYLVAPTSPADRIRRIAARTRGFLYCVSLTGVTGVRRDLPPELAEFLGRVRMETDKPVAVGFGISTPEQVRGVAPHCDAVIVGSAIVDRAARAAGEGRDPAAAVYDFVRELRAALDEV